jgi:hypothetical protein
MRPTEGMRRRERRCKQLPADLKETIRYWNLKGEALDSALWRICFQRDYEPVEGQSTNQ